MPAKISSDLAAYLDAFPAATRKILDKIRATVRKAVPEAEEQRSYGVGAFKRGGTYVIYYAGYAKHVALYPVYKGDANLTEALRPYTSGAATAKFPLDKPVPYDLIAKIVKAKVAEHQARLEKRAATSKGKIGKAARAALAPAKLATKAAPKAAPAKPVKKAAAKKTPKKSAAKKPSPAKAFQEMPNLSWSLLEDVAPKKKVSKKAPKKAAKKPASKK